MTNDTPIANWYPDPNNENELRYWDGSKWTEHTSPNPAASPPPPPPKTQGVDPKPVASSQTLTPEQIEQRAEDIVSSPPPSSSFFSSKKSKDAVYEENAVLRQWIEAAGLPKREQIKKDINNLILDKKHIEEEIAAERSRLNGELTGLREQVVQTNEELILQEVGIYNYRHPLESSIEYQEKAQEVKQLKKQYVTTEGAAVTYPTGLTYMGSAKEGAKVVKQYWKLMLRAYNAEADLAVQKVKPSTLINTIDRLGKALTAITKLGATMDIRITDQYHQLRVYEIELMSDYRAKLEEEKELQRQENARLREAAQLEKEVERERLKFDKEKSHYESAISALYAAGNDEAAAEKEAELEVIKARMEEIEENAANIRVGYVYVISNVGAFGEKMVKIGMTRRLEPLDRVRELGDASVPFRYDVHALIFSKDAVTLETSLHNYFAEDRVNMINNRREFFYVTPAQVRKALEEIAEKNEALSHEMLSFEEWAEAEEYRMSETQRKLETSGAGS